MKNKVMPDDFAVIAAPLASKSLINAHSRIFCLYYNFGMRKNHKQPPIDVDTRLDGSPHAEPPGEVARAGGISWGEIFGFFGIVCLLTWFWTLLFSTGLLNSLDGGVTRGFAQVLHTAGLIIGLLVFLGNRRSSLRQPNGLLLIVVCCIPNAAIITALLTGAAQYHVPLILCLWLLAGAACSVAVAGMATFFGCYRSRTALALLSAASACAAGIALLFSFLQNDAKVTCTCIMLPLALCALFLSGKLNPDYRQKGSADDSCRAKEHEKISFRRFAPFAAGLILYGIVFGFICSMGNNLYADSIGPASAFTAMAIPGVILFVLALATKRPIGATSLQGIAALTAISFLPLLFLGGDATETVRVGAHMVLLACITGFFMIAFALIIHMVHMERTEAARAFLIGQLLHYTGLLIGWLVGMMVYERAGLGSITLHVSAACLIAALILCALALGRKGETHLDSSGDERELEGKTADICRVFELSKREAELFSLLARGYDNQAIEQELFISKNTVKSHVYHIYTKLGVHSKDELLSFIQTWQLH